MRILYLTASPTVRSAQPGTNSFPRTWMARKRADEVRKYEKLDFMARAQRRGPDVLYEGACRWPCTPGGGA